MDLKKLGKTGTLVSDLCLGTMTFGWQADEQESHRILDKFTESGGNFIDTANVYSGGKSEEIIGNWLSHHDRESVVLATKARFKTGEHPNAIGLSRKHLINAVNSSLRRLKTDYIDLLQVHAWDPLTPLEETYSTLNNLVEDGKIRYVGVSNYRAWQFEKALQLCRRMGWNEPVSLQPQYSIFVRATEYEILPMARDENIAILPWSPLAGGFLSGKYKEGVSNAAKGTRIGDASSRDYYKRFETERAKRIISTLENISRETGKTMAQVSLNWLLMNPAVTSPIIGARNLAQLEENLGASGWKLTEKQIESINKASEIDVTYPYDQRSEEQQRSGRELGK